MILYLKNHVLKNTQYHLEYAKSIFGNLKNGGFRVELERAKKYTKKKLFMQ